MTGRQIFSALITAATLAGCAAPPLNFSVPNVGLAQQKLDAELKSLTVTLARPDEQKGPLDLKFAVGQQAGMADQIVPQLWQTSLTEALNRMVIFQDEAAKKVSLSVKILKFEVPEYELTYTVNTIAKYEIIDRRTGDLIFTQDVAASGTTPASYGPLLVRARESINRSVQNNIALFLQSLETVDINKPMFPVTSGKKRQ